MSLLSSIMISSSVRASVWLYSGPRLSFAPSSQSHRGGSTTVNQLLPNNTIIIWVPRAMSIGAGQ